MRLTKLNSLGLMALLFGAIACGGDDDDDNNGGGSSSGTETSTTVTATTAAGCKADAVTRIAAEYKNAKKTYCLVLDFSAAGAAKADDLKTPADLKLAAAAVIEKACAEAQKAAPTNDADLAKAIKGELKSADGKLSLDVSVAVDAKLTAKVKVSGIEAAADCAPAAPVEPTVEVTGCAADSKTYINAKITKGDTSACYVLEFGTGGAAEAGLTVTPATQFLLSKKASDCSEGATPAATDKAVAGTIDLTDAAKVNVDLTIDGDAVKNAELKADAACK